jgi:hypothetical protein
MTRVEAATSGGPVRVELAEPQILTGQALIGGKPTADALVTVIQPGAARDAELCALGLSGRLTRTGGDGRFRISTNLLAGMVFVHASWQSGERWFTGSTPGVAADAQDVEIKLTGQ